jgi:hypothetical protein
MKFFKYRSGETQHNNIGLAKSDDRTKCYGLYGEIKALRDAKIIEEITGKTKNTDWIFIENVNNEFSNESKEEFAYGETVVKTSKQEIKDYILRTVKE